MATRVLILHRQLVFAVTIKQALEQTGLFDVHPFTTPDAAYDYLRDHPQDVALVDFTLSGKPGAQIVRQLRALQPDLAIVVTPNQPEVAALPVQGIIDMPFTARDLIPVIQQAVAQTGGESPTSALPQTKRAADNRTRLLGDNPPERSAPPSMPTKETSHPPAPGQTRRFDDEPVEPPTRPTPQTRILDDQPAAPRNSAQTRKLDEDQPAQTRPLNEVPPPPVDLPEFSTLDRVLKSFDFEPLAGEEDTPPVPQRDSGAVRQYLATAADAEPNTFDEILGAIEPNQPETPRSERQTDFDDLVASLRGSAPHTPLPERQQQSLDFILTSGMDAVLKEIENSKAGAPPAPPPPAPKPHSTFEKLAQEEPPMPSLEESGTVSDLIVGIGDRNFRNVLALLRGEEAEDSRRTNRDSSTNRFDRHDDFANAFTGTEKLPEEAEDPAQIASIPAPRDSSADWWGPEPALADDDSGEETIAHVVLQTALESQPDAVPIKDVMSTIETRLAAHKLKIKPLPSWDMDTQTFRPLNETGVMEPDFLPEEFPPGEMIQPPEDAPELPPSDASSRTTQPSLSVQEIFEPPIQETDTPYDRSFLDETTPSQALREAEPAAIESEPPTLPEPPVVPTWLPETEAEPPFEEPVTAWDEPASPFVGLDAELEAEWSLAEAAPEPLAATEAASVVDDWTLPAPEAEPAADDWTLPASEPETAAEVLEISSEWTPPEGMPSLAHAVMDEGDDPYIVQMALHLTHASLELTAEGSILTRGDELIAFAGQLSPEDVIELQQIIAIEQRANPDGARFRFISLPSSGKDYMLYSIQTASDFTLSLVFAGSTPLRDIRKQAQRLAQALEAVPEVPVVEDEPAPEAVAPPEPEPEPEPVAIVVPPPAEPTTPTSAYACVWLLRDADQRLSDAVAQAIIAGLHVQLQEQGWHIQALQVHEDFVYLLAAVPGERPPNELIRELKRRSADIAHAQDPELTPQLLWADSYLVLTPGRELQTEEILEFINFQRML